LDWGGKAARWMRLAPTAAATLKSGRAGKRKRVSLCPRTEYNTTKPSAGTRNGSHVISIIAGIGILLVLCRRRSSNADNTSGSLKNESGTKKILNGAL